MVSISISAMTFLPPTICRKTGFRFRKDTSKIKTGSEKKGPRRKKQETKANSKS